MRSEWLKNISRVVVKLGTGVLTDARKQLDPAQLEQIVAQVAALRKAGKEVVVVTSGAGLVQYNGTPITGFGAIAAGATSNAASDVPFIWPATALRIRADFVLVTDTGYTTTVTLNLNR